MRLLDFLIPVFQFQESTGDLCGVCIINRSLKCSGGNDQGEMSRASKQFVCEFFLPGRSVRFMSRALGVEKS